MALIWGWSQAESFFREGWTGQISLIPLNKLSQARRAALTE
jgi:hypothetical protein